MKYMLDTNMIAYAVNRRPAQVLENIHSHLQDGLCISAVTMAELEYGICNSSRPEQNRLALMLFLSPIEVLPFDALAAAHYGTIRADLKRRSEPIGANDMLIAAHARSLGLTLVSNNLKEFEKVEGLVTENWTM